MNVQIRMVCEEREERCNPPPPQVESVLVDAQLVKVHSRTIPLSIDPSHSLPVVVLLVMNAPPPLKLAVQLVKVHPWRDVHDCIEVMYTPPPLPLDVH